LKLFAVFTLAEAEGERLSLVFSQRSLTSAYDTTSPRNRSAKAR